MSNVTVNSYRGMGLSGWLTLIFVTLKLVGFITWSWWWVLRPIWIGVVLFFAILLFDFLLAFISEFAGGR